jgi:hypothetical protein
MSDAVKLSEVPALFERCSPAGRWRTVRGESTRAISVSTARGGDDVRP